MIRLEKLLTQFFEEHNLKYQAHNSHGLYYDVGPSTGTEYVIDVTPESAFYRKAFVKGDVVLSKTPSYDGAKTEWTENWFLNVHNPNFFDELQKVIVLPGNDNHDGYDHEGWAT